MPEICRARAWSRICSTLSPASLYLSQAASQPSDFSSCAAALTRFSTSLVGSPGGGATTRGAAALDGAAAGAGAAGLAPGITTLPACAEVAQSTRTERLRADGFLDVSVCIHVGLRGRDAFLPLEQRAVAAGLERGLGESLRARLELERLVVHFVLASRPQRPGFAEAVADDDVRAVNLEDLDPVGLGFLRLDRTEVEALSGGLEARVPAGGELQLLGDEETLVGDQGGRTGGHCECDENRDARHCRGPPGSSDGVARLPSA